MNHLVLDIKKINLGIYHANKLESTRKYITIIKFDYLVFPCICNTTRSFVDTYLAYLSSVIGIGMLGTTPFDFLVVVLGGVVCTVFLKYALWKLKTFFLCWSFLTTLYGRQ